MIVNELDFIAKLSLSNSYRCPRCGATVKLPIQTPGQVELFAPLCYNCGNEMEDTPKI